MPLPAFWHPEGIASGKGYRVVDGDAFDDAMKVYQKLNGGTLYNRIKIAKLPKDQDVCDLKGKINEYYVIIK